MNVGLGLRTHSFISWNICFEFSVYCLCSRPHKTLPWTYLCQTPQLTYYIQQCFICRPSDSTVPTDAGIEPRTVASGALTVRRSNHLARSHPHLARSHPLDPTTQPPQITNFAKRHTQLIHVTPYNFAMHPPSHYVTIEPRPPHHTL